MHDAHDGQLKAQLMATQQQLAEAQRQLQQVATAGFEAIRSDSKRFETRGPSQCDACRRTTVDHGRFIPTVSVPADG